MDKHINTLNFISKNKSFNIWALIPMFGILAFAILYIVATFFYPGGSQYDPVARGFSWAHNYWCNLLSVKAVNGEYNSSQPIALSAMLVLSFSLSVFWLTFPKNLDISDKHKRLIQVSGTSAMSIPFFYFTRIDHDTITNLASFFGLIATVGTLFCLYKMEWQKLFFFGIVNMLLIGLNNIFYYTSALNVYLPVIQKITFAAFLIWFLWISVNLYNVCGTGKKISFNSP